MLTIDQRHDRYMTYLREGRITHHQWLGQDAQGRALACALAAYAPEAGEAGAWAACPANALPPWVAALLPSLDDGVSDAYRPEMLTRLGGVLRGLATMTPDRSRRTMLRTLRVAVLESRTHVADDSATLPAVDGVIALLDREIGGGHVTEAEWRAAARAAWAAASEAAAAAAAARAAWAAASAAAAAAASAAAWAAWAAASAWAAWAAAAWDRMAAAMLDVWESETGGEHG